MNLLRNITTGLRTLLHKEDVAKEIDAELRGYFDSVVDEGMRSGMTREQAMREARMKMGSVASVKDNIGRDGWERAVEAVWQDVRYGVRMMRKAPGLTAVAVLTLALGIGASSAMFGIVYGLLYRSLPFPDAGRIAVVNMNFAPQNNPRGNMSLADFVDWKNGNTTFEKVAAYGASRFTLTGQTQAEQVVGASVSADFFSILGIAPMQGRTFQPGDDAASGPILVVLSESLWQRRFGGSRDIIGRVIEVNGNPATVIGVVREGYGFPRAQMELWQNLHLKVTRRGPFFFHGIGRLRPGVAFGQGQAETNAISRNIERASPHTYSNLTMPVEPLRNFIVGDLRPMLFMIFAAVLAVLLIATVNIANLLLARATTREREMAVRLSLGAGRRRLIQQLLTESILLSLTGAAAGLLLAYASVRVFRILNPANVPMTYQVHLDWRLLLFTGVISVVAGALFGCVPALQSARVELLAPLKQGGRDSSGATHQRMRATLVVAEIAISLVLLMTAGLLLRSFVLLQQVHLGTSAPPANVLTMVVTPKTLRLGQKEDSGAMVGFYQRVAEDVNQLPGVQYAAISDSLPPDQPGEDDTFRIAGQPWSEEAFPSTTLPKVSPNYFRALGVPLMRGRFFTADDTANSRAVTIISESLARRYFPGKNPIGQKIGASGPTNTDPFMDVVGVVGDIKYWGIDSAFRPAYYQPYTQNFNSSMFLIVRSPQAAAALAPMIERKIHTLDKDAVVRRMLTMEDLLGESVAQPRFRTMLLSGFGGLALLLSAVGIYGVIAYSVTQRTQEIGIRMALGAQRRDVLKMVMGSGAVLALIGIGIGLVGSFAAARGISRFLFATSTDDPLILGAGCGLMLLVALAATLIPSMRAVRTDPHIALRHE